MKTTKVFKTANNTILIVTASTDGTGEQNRYVSVTASEISPLSYEDAKERNREYLEEGEGWKWCVENDKTELGLAEWIEYVINKDGEISTIDNSLYPNEVNINGDTYIFDSLGCGCMHDDINAVTDMFKTLIKLHLSKEIEAAEAIIKSIAPDNVDALVEQYANEIVKGIN